ncbi:SHOCT domain-containing protein [Pseudodesulfovibrio cashew]|uniref:SHOCT domain-containing protein n=1 Tax=Pseudodesulfovibrio cashew TaxID=2678688 RepID=A0A6I6JL40_9BACT|nr:SHOCT domain-containing protein [Pseudodesulfovibrio cashew]QGY40993.1 SHOCT domain-containing protein [Pseudodesulfovibrio cashew]
MILNTIPNLVSGFFDFLDSPAWRAWPFNSGYGEQIGPAIARMAFVALIFAVIILFLRVLFGPKGIFRDKEMDREAAEEVRRERAELEERFAKGDISEMEFNTKMKSLKD